MAASGVSVRDEVVAEYNNIKIGHKYSYIQLKLTDDKTAIEVEKAVPSEKRSPADEKKAFEDFVQELPPSDCRYVVYDFHFETTHSGSREQLIFVVWWVNWKQKNGDRVPGWAGRPACRIFSFR